MRNRVLLLCLVSGLLLVPRVNWAAEKCFLILSDIRGESQDALHANWIDVDSWSMGATRTGTSATAVGGAVAGKASFQDFHFVMPMSIASPLILSACSSGRYIQEARLACRKDTGKNDYLRMSFTDVLISSYQTGGSSSGGGSPRDQISFSYGKISQEYLRLLSDGSLGSSVRFDWDINKNVSMSPPITGSGSGVQGGGSSSGGAVSGQVPPPTQTPVKTTPSIISPQRIKAK
jgi:type VI secretion system secreted protein Hcp